ncbi:MAG: hypothetical protein JEZ06_20075 [Anaerolineaceae bacterium]|nr:hypothetical protein [Anaerolineaceae bacterium]
MSLLEETPKYNKRQFSQEIYKFTHHGQAMNGNLTYPTWDKAFQKLSGYQSGLDNLQALLTISPDN